MFITYLSTTCFGAYGHLQVDELTKKPHISSYIWHASYIRRMVGGVIGWGYEISCVLGSEGVYMGLYYANPSVVQFRAMMLGVHVYVYIGYMVMDIQ